MSRGKKLDNETIYKIMLSYAVTRNYSETGRNLGIPESTVRKIVDDNKEDELFAKLCEQKRDEFVESADKIIYKATNLLERKLDVALDYQNELDVILSIASHLDGDEELSNSELRALINRVNKLQVNALTEITTAIGTMYDKRALAKGDPTSNEKFEVSIRVIE